MSSIRKDKRNGNWIACITLPDGRRTTRTTQIPIAASTPQERTAQKEQAEDLARQWEKVGRLAKAKGLSKEHARQVLNDILKSAGVEELETLTVRVFLRDWLAGKVNPGTRARYSHVVDRFLAACTERADKPLSDVTYSDILAFVQSRRREGVAPKTLVVDTKCLGNAFNLARRLGHTTVNPVEQALALNPLKTESSEKSVFTVAQLESLVSAAEGDWLTVILVGFYTGARLRDCCNLKAGQVDLAAGVITITQGKTGGRAWIPIHPCLLHHLSSLVANQELACLLCPSLAGRKTGGKSGLSREFADIMAKAGVNPGLRQGKGKRRFSALSFHSLRHSFNSALANKGVDQETRMALTGQVTTTSNTDYTHLDLPKLQNAVYLLPNILSAAVSSFSCTEIGAAAGICRKEECA